MRRLAKKVAAKLLGRGHAHIVREANAAHDMAADPDEAYYRDQYLHWLLPALEKLPAGRASRILDLGCGHGRLALAAAEWANRGSVTGVDFSEKSLSSARRYAADRGLKNIQFTQADAVQFVKNAQPGGFDAVLCTEMLYNLPAWRAALRDVHRLMAPGGLLFASFRSRWFDLLKSVRAGDFESARLVRDRREGNWGGGRVWSAWQTAADVRATLTELGFKEPAIRGIGVFSGIDGDPMAQIARPSSLSEPNRKDLMGLELSLAGELADQGRYILAITRRNS